MSSKKPKMSNFYLLLVLLKLLTISMCVEQKLLRINTDLTAATIAPMAANVVDAAGSQSNAAAQPIAVGAHICMREETYVEQVKVPSMQPVRIRSSEWCLEFPPRCSNYKTEMREVVQVQNVTKTRTIRFCCAGYEGNISINDTVCKPVCRGGCGRGHCQTPDVCSCEPGYTGTHCTQRCDHDHWGDECKQECQCQNGAVCDNKTGLCHCTTGWTGEFCQLPCPPGTYGVMCYKQCECPNKLCHPQTGACTSTNNNAPNATHVMIQTLNSTIANITHNLDRIAQNIVNIVTTSTSTSTSNLELSESYGATTTVKTLPEVIVIKQDDQHTPKIIVHQAGAAGLLEDLHTAAAKTPEVIHVITTATAGWPVPANTTATERKLELAGFGGGLAAVVPTISTVTGTPANSAAEHDANLLTTLLIILLIIMIALAMGFLYVYRRYHWQKARAETALTARNASGSAASTAEIGGNCALAEAAGGKSYLKPLPDLPGFTQMVCNKIEGPEFYDSPSNNSSINAASYDYARKLSLYSVVSPKSRKGSPDSHLYDEIRYPSSFQQHSQTHDAQRRHHHHPHHHQQQQQHQQHHTHPTHATHQSVSTHHILPPFQQTHPHTTHVPSQPVPVAQHHITHLIIPPQNANFLQVPPMSNTNTTRKVALL